MFLEALGYEWLNQSAFRPGCRFGFPIIQVVATKCLNSGLLLFVVKMEKSQSQAGEGEGEGVIIGQISPHTLAPFSLATPEKAALLKLLPLDHRSG